MVAIWVGSSFPVPPTPLMEFELGDKVAHAVVFGVLAILIRYAFGRSTRMPGWQSFAAVLVATAYGAIDELHQSFVPGRTADVWDFVADAGGATFLVALAAAIHVILRRRKRGGAATVADRTR
jgi:VanZ family protein